MAFRAGKRVEGLIDVALGCLLLRKTSSTPAVVPGAAPALAKAGVGGLYCLLLHDFLWIFHGYFMIFYGYFKDFS